MGLGRVFPSLLSLAAKLVPGVSESVQVRQHSSSLPTGGHQIEGVSESVQVRQHSSSLPTGGHQIEDKLTELTGMLKLIKAKLYAVEGRKVIDSSSKLWLKELRQVAYDAEDVLDEYNYEVLRAQIESRGDYHGRKLVQIPDGMFDQIERIIDRFKEIEGHRMQFHLSDEDGPRRPNKEWQRNTTSHHVDEKIIGRETEKEKLIDMLFSECYGGEVVSVVAIVGTGGLGKTTLAQLACNDKRINPKKENDECRPHEGQFFEKILWICVSEDFNVESLMRESIEHFTGSTCDLTDLSTLQNELSEKVRGKRVLVVLDDVWNEIKHLWWSFKKPFLSATLAKFLVTTRNESVANMMQAASTIYLKYLSKDQCWQLFQKYAFGDFHPDESSELVTIAKNIMNKCGMLPLAIKSIASLLRLEKTENWVEILESELWESDASNEIFPPLQISYTRLPTYLKPCYLYCSMFSKGYRYSAEKLVYLWISQGYIETNNGKNAEEIGWAYVEELWQRSFFEGAFGGQQFHLAKFKLHDMIHDLARFNSENEYHSIISEKVPYSYNELRHLSVGNDVKIPGPLPSEMFAALRTLIISGLLPKSCPPFNFEKAQKLRALELGYQVCDLETLFNNFVLKHLRYLSLNKFYERLPESMCSLYNLQNLTLSDCSHVEELPKRIGNLVSLEVLVLDGCPDLKRLPKSLHKLSALRKLIIARCSKLEELPACMGCLTNLQSLKISQTEITSLPPGLSKFVGMQVSLSCQAIGWLKDFSDLKGTLNLVRLNRMSGLDDARCAKLVRMHNLQCLKLSWSEPESSDLHPYFDSEKGTYGNILQLAIRMSFHQNTFLDDQNDLSLIEVLQPHSNLRELHIVDYSGSTLPNWIGNPTSCASLEKIVLVRCKNLTVLPFGRLYILKFLEIYHCSSLQFLQEDSLPPGLQQLEIYGCGELISVPGIQNLIKSLVKLTINGCRNLESLMMDAGSSVDLKMLPSSSYENTVVGISDFTSLRSLQIQQCPQLQLFAEDLPPKESCKLEIDWPSLKEGGFQRSITYKDIVPNDEKQIVLRSAESSGMAEDRLQSAQGQKKKKVAIRRCPSEFQKGEDVWLRVSPVKRSCRSRTASKLASRYIGPFEILHRIGGQKYKLALPATLLDRLGTEFHVSQLQKKIKNSSDIINYSVLHLEDDLTYKVMPMRILNTKETRLRNKTVRQVLVQWELHSEEEATWELENEIHEKYPQLFLNSDRTGTVLDLEAEEGTSL